MPILTGCIVGGAIIHLLALTGNWYLIGIPAGGAIAWLAYCLPDIVQYTPLIWRRVTGRSHDPKTFSGWRERFMTLVTGWSIILGIGIGIIYLQIAAAIAMIAYLLHADPSRYLLDLAIIAAICFATGMLITCIAAFNVSRKPDRYRFDTEIEMMQQTFKNVLPHMLLLHELTLARVISVGTLHFFLWLFVAVHSQDTFDCFLYTAIGLAIGIIFTQTWWVIVISTIAGLGLAFAMRWLARNIVAPRAARP